MFQDSSYKFLTDISVDKWVIMQTTYYAKNSFLLLVDIKKNEHVKIEKSLRHILGRRVETYTTYSGVL